MTNERRQVSTKGERRAKQSKINRQYIATLADLPNEKSPEARAQGNKTDDLPSSMPRAPSDVKRLRASMGFAKQEEMSKKQQKGKNKS